ncbi:MAG: iron-containing alcohol dehydrogenase [Marivibrio sp.]|uniref:iron-containing alcohol dehydrogenase n=1 Tax=Marivibrio sp. TaxID=2039719 RepID=UPI0032F054E3
MLDARAPDEIAILQYLTHIRLGFGALCAVGEDLQALGASRPLIVSDHGIAGAGLLARLTAALPGEAGALFLDTPPNPSEAAVRAAAQLYRDASCDGVVAFGGGSSIDLAKAVAVLAGQGGALIDYALIRGGAGKITDAIAPLIAIPTTAGTGSEVGRAALITFEGGRKMALVSPHLIPRRAICDPDLLLGAPASLTAATGMDALAHCVETFFSPKINPPADAIALDGARRLARWLEAAVADGSDRRARWETMTASLQGGLTFQKGLGAVHGLSHALGGYGEAKLHHGLLNALLLPPVLRHNAGAAPEKEAALRQAMGLGPHADLADAFSDLNRRIGIGERLEEGAVAAADFETIARHAMEDHSTATNPRAMTVEVYAELLRAVL